MIIDHESKYIRCQSLFTQQSKYVPTIHGTECRMPMAFRKSANTECRQHLAVSIIQYWKCNFLGILSPYPLKVDLMVEFQCWQNTEFRQYWEAECQMPTAFQKPDILPCIVPTRVPIMKEPFMICQKWVLPAIKNSTYLPM